MNETDRNGTKNSKAFSFIDLFAGIGGLRRGFENVGGECVFTSEWNKFSRLTYEANYESNHVLNGDITKIDEKEIPSHDVLLAGFPCQPFSIAGIPKKNSLGIPHGFECKTQGTLFFDVARILKFHRPEIFVLENVKNLKSHDKGQTFKTIVHVLEELGYHLSYKIINAKYWVPQKRERIFIVGFREPSDFSFDDVVLPCDESNLPKLKDILHPEDGTEEYGPNDRYIDENGKVLEKYVLSDKLWSGLRRHAEKHKSKGNGFGFAIGDPEGTARTMSARYGNDGAEILIERPEGNPRKLTPRECSRLMGFDSPKGSDFVIPVSDSQAYRQFGNAVVPPVAESLAKAITLYFK